MFSTVSPTVNIISTACWRCITWRLEYFLCWLVSSDLHCMKCLRCQWCPWGNSICRGAKYGDIKDTCIYGTYWEVMSLPYMHCGLQETGWRSLLENMDTSEILIITWPQLRDVAPLARVISKRRWLHREMYLTLLNSNKMVSRLTPSLSAPTIRKELPCLIEAWLLDSMLWLKWCVVPFLPNEAIDINVVYLVVHLAYGQPLGLLPSIICNL